LVTANYDRRKLIYDAINTLKTATTAVSSLDAKIKIYVPTANGATTATSIEYKTK
jgi:hypothetical protein